MKITVDFDLCESNAVCVEECPEVFEVDEQDFLQLHEDRITEKLYDAIRDAARRCPKQAIFLEE